MKFAQYLLRLITGSLHTDTVEDEMEMATVRHRPEALELLEAQSKFTKKELQILYRGFKNECPSGVVNEETFKEIYSQFFPQGDSTTYAHFLFNAFDTDHNGSVSFEDFVMGLSILLRGTVQEKLNWAFNLYDINKDGYITKEEMLDIMKAIYDMMGKCTYPVLKEDAPRQHVETFFQKMDKNKDGVVTIDEFIESCQKFKFARKRNMIEYKIRMTSLWHEKRFIESQNMLSWKAPTRIIESSSWLYTRHPKIKVVVYSKASH
ncbi:hypothetical protein HGM15179_003718 [Zosterops borbonicus]|uniref:Kv channel-interacting protein 4 n=1 Tax=Zosterops borbonicus TaxID=364589 RepID=A0A8K1GRE5_9PASS|nr:hypothetical protein HGM15179_003718 [Zosterops borbonicus]